MLTTQETADKLTSEGLKFTAEGVAELARSQVFPGAKKIAGVWRIPAVDVDHFISQRRQTRQQRRLLGSIAAFLLFIFTAISGTKDGRDLIRDIFYSTIPTAIITQNNTPISTSAPTQAVQVVASATDATRAATVTATSTAALPTSAPTIAPTVAPTATLNTTTPEGVTAAYLDALNKNDVEQVRRLTSQHSLDALEQKRENITIDSYDGTMIYRTSTAVALSGVLDTVRVPVEFLSDDYMKDCCVLRKENGEWRVNWRYDINSGENKEPNYYSLVDYQLVKSEQQVQNDVAVRPTRVLRFADVVQIYVALENSQDKCVHVGVNGTRAIVYFDNKKAYDEKPSFYRRRFSTSSGDGYMIVTVPRQTTTFPTSVELLDWQWPNPDGSDCDFGDGPKWSYIFNLEY